MEDDKIVLIEKITLTEKNIFCIKPSFSFDKIYRSARGVKWDNKKLCLYTVFKADKNHSLLMCYYKILGAVKDEYGKIFKMNSDTIYENIDNDTKASIESILNNNKESYLIKILFYSDIYYAIWETANENDWLLTKGGKILVSQSKNKIVFDSVLQQNEPVIYNFDFIRKILQDGFKSINYSELLNFWNLTQDAAFTINYKFLGQKRKYNKLYEQVFYGNNIFAKPNDELYIPKLTTKDLKNLTKLILQAFEMWSEIFKDKIQ